jgi:hypothetical protein
MKNVLKNMRPYIIFNAIIFGILGMIIGKNLVEIHNTKKRISNDSQALKRFIKEMAKTCPNKMSLDELENEDDRKPIEPTPIYIYD